MRRTWKGIMVIGLMAFGLYAQESDQPGAVSGAYMESRQVIYVVQPNDTLWDIAARFMNSPYYWPKIWERNSFIINPNLIFPGDVINLYPEGEKLVPEIETVPKIAPPAEPSKEGEEEAEVVRTPTGQVARVVYKETPSVGWIEAKEFERAGKITGSLDNRTLLGEQDMVYVNIGSSSGAKKGDLFSIFRVTELVKHPVTKKRLGYKILNLGELEITEMTETGATARVVNSYQEIKEGDYIRPYLPPLTAEVPIIKSEKKLEGYIVANKKDTPSFAQGDIVYIDLGKADGIQSGNVMEVYYPGKKITENKEKKQLPDIVIGKLVVIDPRENTSVALVTESFREFKIGDRIRLSENP